MDDVGPFPRGTRRKKGESNRAPPVNLGRDYSAFYFDSENILGRSSGNFQARRWNSACNLRSCKIQYLPVQSGFHPFHPTNEESDTLDLKKGPFHRKVQIDWSNRYFYTFSGCKNWNNLYADCADCSDFAVFSFFNKSKTLKSITSPELKLRTLNRARLKAGL
jgi:hypothetical protein